MTVPYNKDELGPVTWLAPHLLEIWAFVEENKEGGLHWLDENDELQKGCGVQLGSPGVGGGYE